MCESRKSLAEARAVGVEKEEKKKKKRCQKLGKKWPRVMKSWLERVKMGW